jgi:hypothetical protein
MKVASAEHLSQPLLHEEASQIFRYRALRHTNVDSVAQQPLRKADAEADAKKRLRKTNAATRRVIALAPRCGRCLVRRERDEKAWLAHARDDQKTAVDATRRSPRTVA